MELMGSFAVLLVGTALIYSLRILEQTIQGLLRTDTTATPGSYNFMMPLSDYLKMKPSTQSAANSVTQTEASAPVAKHGQYL